MPEDNTTPEFTLDDVVSVEPDQLSVEQKTFLETNKADLTPEQAEKFGIKVEEEEDEEPRTRATTTPEKKTEEEEDDLDPDDEARINKMVDKRLAQSGVGDTRDQLQVSAFVRDNPEYSKYADRALKYMKTIPDLVAEDAFRIVSAKDQQKIGAQKEREAFEKARGTTSSGTQFRAPAGGGIDWSKATAEEISAKRNEVINSSRE